MTQIQAAIIRGCERLYALLGPEVAGYTIKFFEGAVDTIVGKYGIKEEQSVNQLFDLLALAPMFAKEGLSTDEELSTYPPHIVEAVLDCLKFINPDRKYPGQKLVVRPYQDSGEIMNEKQKKLLIAVLAVVAGMLIFPPFHNKLPNGTVSNLGYSLIFDPPKVGYLTGAVDIGLFFTQWVGVLIVGGIAFFLFKDR